MFQPSGVLAMAITSAPARESAIGAVNDDAPFAQSTTTFKPLSETSMVESKCSM